MSLMLEQLKLQVTHRSICPSSTPALDVSSAVLRTLVTGMLYVGSYMADSSGEETLKHMRDPVRAVYPWPEVAGVSKT